MSEALPQVRLAAADHTSRRWLPAGRHPGSRVLAGGTDLVVNMRRGLLEPSALVDVTGVEELRRWPGTTRGLSIGAGVTLAALAG
jgi:CO/xanthine dehydrogenase FAD-binding subunit